MPLFKTKMMPASAERLSTRGLPPFGLGASSGNNGSIVFHSSSDTSSLAMSFPYPHQRVLKGSLSHGACQGGVLKGEHSLGHKGRRHRRRQWHATIRFSR